MQVPLSQVRQTLTKIYSSTGADKEDIQQLVEMALDLDLRKNTFCGITEIDWDMRELKESLTKKHQVEVDAPSMKLINGNGRSGRLIGREMVELVCAMAKKQGIAVVGLYNSTYHHAMEFYARQIAAQDLIGIVFANGGPQGVTPFLGSQPITGTNPMSYGIPTQDFPISFDAATSLYPYGSIRLAKQAEKTLPDGSYVNKEGQYTTDPHQAVGIVPFGGHKGYAVNLMIEVLTGALVKAKMGLQLKNENDLGSVFIAIDPSVFQPIDEFKAQTSQLVKEILAVPPVDSKNVVQVPGYRSEAEKQKMMAADQLEVSDQNWAKYEELVKKYIEQQ